MKASRLSALILLLFVCCLTSASPKARNWDKVLDRYEILCQQCLELKRQADSGKEIPKHRFSKLIRELNSLKSELKEASGQMSEEQEERFALIRDRFLEAQSPRQRDTRPVAKPPTINAQALALPQIIVLYRPLTRQLTPPQVKPEDYVVEHPAKQIPCPEQLEWAHIDALEVSRPQKKPASRSVLLGRKFYLSGIACVSIYPKPNYSILLALDPLDAPLGAYIHAGSNFAPRSYDYDCLSDGTTSYGTIWTSGRTSYFTTQASIGPCYRINSRLRAYAGLGYGSALTLWEDSSGKWARVADRSPRGLLFELGSIFNIGRVNLSISYSCTALKLSELQLGIGYSF